VHLSVQNLLTDYTKVVGWRGRLSRGDPGVERLKEVRQPSRPYSSSICSGSAIS